MVLLTKEQEKARIQAALVAQRLNAVGTASSLVSGGDPSSTAYLLHCLLATLEDVGGVSSGGTASVVGLKNASDASINPATDEGLAAIVAAVAALADQDVGLKNASDVIVNPATAEGLQAIVNALAAQDVGLKNTSGTAVNPATAEGLQAVVDALVAQAVVDSATSRSSALPIFSSQTITDETVIISAPGAGNHLYITSITVQNKIDGPCEILIQNDLTAGAPTTVWPIEAPAKGAGYSEAFSENNGILWDENKPLVIKPLPAQALSVAVAYKTVDIYGKAVEPDLIPDVLISTGQSNWAGAGNDVTTYTGTYPVLAKHWVTSGGGQFVPMNPANGFRTQNNPTLHLALEYERLNPGKELLVIEDGQPGGGFESGTGEFATGGATRIRLIDKITNGIASLETLTTGYNLIGFLLNLGETDAGSTTDADNFSAELLALTNEIDAITGIDTNKIYTRINDSVPGLAGLATVRTVLETLSDVFVNVDDITLGSDNIHYPDAGYVEIGQRQLTQASTLTWDIFAFTPATEGAITADFTALSALPAEYSLNADATIAFTNGLVVSPDSPATWGDASVESISVDLDAQQVDIEFLGLNGNGAIGLSAQRNWLLAARADDSLMWAGNGGVYRGNGTVDSVPHVADSAQKISLRKVGGDVIVDFSRDSSVIDTFAFTDTANGFASVKVIIDAFQAPITVKTVTQTTL